MSLRPSAAAARPPRGPLILPALGRPLRAAAGAAASACRGSLAAASSAQWLGQIRFVTCAILLAFTVREDFSGLAALPPAMRVDMGVLRWLYAVPGFAAFAADPRLLQAAQAVTALLLVAGAVGWRTRAVIPLAAAGTLVLGGVWRQYCHLYHTGLIPWYVLAALCLTPCGDALSLDRRRRNARLRAAGLDPSSDLRPPAAYGWAVLLCWAAVAVPYTLCGLSKLRSGGLDWWAADNLRAILYVDNLQPMDFHLGLGFRLADAPDWMLSAAALAVVVVETAFVFVLVSRRARLVLPLAMAGVHLGILLFQHVPFPDLIVAQLVFYDLTGRSSRGPKPARPVANWSGWQRLMYPAPLVAMVLLFAATWARKTEFYPLTSWRMYCGANPSGRVVYTTVAARRADGRLTPVPLGEAAPALTRGEARYRDALGWAFSARPGRAAASDAFLRFAGGRLNARAGGGGGADDIVALEVSAVAWDYKASPADPARGVVVRTRVVPIVPAAPALVPPAHAVARAAGVDE